MMSTQAKPSALSNEEQERRYSLAWDRLNKAKAKLVEEKTERGAKKYDFETETHLTAPAWEALRCATERFAENARMTLDELRPFWQAYVRACRVYVSENNVVIHEPGVEDAKSLIESGWLKEGERLRPLEPEEQKEQDAFRLEQAQAKLKTAYVELVAGRINELQVLYRIWNFVQFVLNARQSGAGVSREQSELWNSVRELSDKLREQHKTRSTTMKGGNESERESDSKTNLPKMRDLIVPAFDELVRTKYLDAPQTDMLAGFASRGESPAVVEESEDDAQRALRAEEPSDTAQTLRITETEGVVVPVSPEQARSLEASSEKDAQTASVGAASLFEQADAQTPETPSDAAQTAGTTLSEAKLESISDERVVSTVAPVVVESFKEVGRDEERALDYPLPRSGVLNFAPEEERAPTVFVGDDSMRRTVEHVEIRSAKKVEEDTSGFESEKTELDELREKEAGEFKQEGLFGDIAVEEEVVEPIFTDDEMIDAAFRYHRERGFPYRELSPAMCMASINALALTKGQKLIHTSEGYMVADTYHRHRFHANATGKLSPKQAFDDDRRLKRAIALELKLGGKPFVYAGGMITLVLGTQACSNFRPGFAAYLYREFAPENAVVLDTSTGYGGRLIGAVASRRVARYIGVDPNVPTHEANIRMAKDLGFAHMVELINCPAEDVDCEQLRERCDFSFTSPPYFAKEQYAHDDTQSWIRYKTGVEWRDKFLKPMLTLQFVALKPGSFNIVNIAAVNVKGKRYPLDEWTIELGKKVGFTYVKTEKFPMMKRFGANQGDEVAFEPVIIFKKETA